MSLINHVCDIYVLKEVALLIRSRLFQFHVSLTSHIHDGYVLKKDDQFAFKFNSSSPFPSFNLRNRANQLTLGLIPRHLPMSLLDLLPRENLLNKNLETAILKLGQSMLDKLIPQLALILLVAAAQPAALEPRPLAEKQRHVRLLVLGSEFRAGQSGQVDDDAVPGDGAQVRGESLRADEIHDDVDALAVGCFQDFVGPVGLCRVEGCGAAEGGSAEGGLLVAAGCREDG